MTFQRGQGMNHGIADAASFVTKLKSALDDHSSVKNAVKAYNIEMIERAGDEVATSKENTEMLRDWLRMMDSPIMQKGGHPRSQQPSTEALGRTDMTSKLAPRVRPS